MTILFVDGFDHYATADIASKWTTVNAFAINSTAGRRGGGAATMNNNTSRILKALPSALSTVVFGFAFKPTVSGSASSYFCTLRDGTVTHLSFNLNSLNKIEARRGPSTSNVLLGTSSSSLTVGIFSYIEIKAVISDSVGAVTIKVNGQEVLALTGIDTQNAGNASVNEVGIGDPSSNSIGNTSAVDDLYICDTNGTTNNDFLGDVRIDPLYANGAGTYQSWTPSTGTDHYALIDETSPNATDYLTGGASGTKETNALQNLSVNGNILGIQVNNYLAKTDAGGCTVKNLIKSGSSEAYSGVISPSTGYSYGVSIHELDPATSAAWLTASVNALEVGAEVVS